MADYEDFSNAQLMNRIEELEEAIKKLQATIPTVSLCCTSSNNQEESTNFRETHGSKIRNALPDMLSVFDNKGNYIALASAEETVHTGDSSAGRVGKNLLEILPPEAYPGIKKNLDKAIITQKASSAFHKLDVHGTLEYFENRVVPLDSQYVLCICRNISNTIKAQNDDSRNISDRSPGLDFYGHQNARNGWAGSHKEHPKVICHGSDHSAGSLRL